MFRYLMGLDLGQVHDYTAIAIAEPHKIKSGEHEYVTTRTIQPPDITGSHWMREAWRKAGGLSWQREPITISKTNVVEDFANHYQVRYLERLPLGTTYPAIVAHVDDLLSRPPLQGNTALIVDATGVGQAVVDLLTEARLRPISVTITGGDSVIRPKRDQFRVPKRDLIGALQVLFQTERLKIAQELPAAAQLVEELVNLRVKINLQTAQDRYEAWREGIHDDLVLAVALAVWFGELNIPQGYGAV